MKDCYSILNVKQDMPLDEIKSSYRKLLKKYHPDTYMGDKQFAQAKTIELNKAYAEILKCYKNKNIDKNVNNEEKVFENSNTVMNENEQEIVSSSNEINIESDYEDGFATDLKVDIDSFNEKPIENSAIQIDELYKSKQQIKQDKKAKRILDALIISLSLITIVLILLMIYL